MDSVSPSTHMHYVLERLLAGSDILQEVLKLVACWRADV